MFVARDLFGLPLCNQGFFYKLSKYLWGLACLATLLSLSWTTFALRGAKADTLQDYLVQEVCDMGGGAHTSADPATCPTTARKLNIGETLPYHKWNYRENVEQNISDSFPVQQINGLTRVVANIFWESGGTIVPLYNATDPDLANSKENPHAAGYDIYTTDEIGRASCRERV